MRIRSVMQAISAPEYTRFRSGARDLFGRIAFAYRVIAEHLTTAAEPDGPTILKAEETVECRLAAMAACRLPVSGGATWPNLPVG